jgi:hypothetical protein
MKKLHSTRMILLALGLMILLGASTLYATPGPVMLRLSSGTTTVNITDEGANDQYTVAGGNPDGLGFVMWSGSVGAWNVSYTSGDGYPYDPAGILNLSSTASASSKGTLDIWLTQTNLVGNPRFQFDFNSDLLGSSPGASVSYAAYIGYDNTAFEQSSMIASSGSFTLPPSSTPTSNSGTSTGAITSASPYSLTLRTTITSASTVKYSGGAGIQPQPVPEPASILLLGTGIAGLAWKVRKSRRRRAPGLS